MGYNWGIGVIGFTNTFFSFVVHAFFATRSLAFLPPCMSLRHSMVVRAPSSPSPTSHMVILPPSPPTANKSRPLGSKARHITPPVCSKDSGAPPRERRANMSHTCKSNKTTDRSLQRRAATPWSPKSCSHAHRYMHEYKKIDADMQISTKIYRYTGVSVNKQIGNM